MSRCWTILLMVLMLGAGTAWGQDSVAVTVKSAKPHSHSSKKKTGKKTKKSPKRSKKAKTKKSKTKAKKSKNTGDPQVETEIDRQAVTIDLQGK